MGDDKKGFTTAQTEQNSDKATGRGGGREREVGDEDRVKGRERGGGGRREREREEGERVVKRKRRALN